jgi:YesN/AraC family two-component response regulator
MDTGGRMVSGVRPEQRPLLHDQSRLSILIAEDDKTTRNILALMLAKKFPDITFYFAENGKLGVELFKERTPEIVITDVNMPVMNGIQMAVEIKALNRKTKFIVLTAYSDKIENCMESFGQIGLSDCLPKPLEFGKLFAAIEKCVEEVLQEQE